MIKTLKLLKSAIKQKNYLKLSEISNSTIPLSTIIKCNTFNTIVTLFFFSLLICIEMFLLENTWASTLILVSSLFILAIFLTIRLIIYYFNPDEKFLTSIYYCFLSFGTTLTITCLIAKVETFEFISTKDFNNGKVSIFFLTLFLHSLYSHFFSQIKQEGIRILLSVIHKILILAILLITIKLDIFYYCQSVVFELLSLILLVSSSRIKMFKNIHESDRKPEELKTLKTEISNNQNEWKAMLNEFPIGVVILSKEKKVLFSNKIVRDMFELHISDPPTILQHNPLDHMEKTASLMHLTKNNTLGKEIKLNKVSFDELNTKIGKLEEVENSINDDEKPIELHSHTYSSSNELTIYSHKSILRKPPFLYHYNSVNPNIRTSSPHNSKTSYSILSSMRIAEKEKEIEQKTTQKSSVFQPFSETGPKHFKTENVLNYKNEGYTAKTKKVNVKVKGKTVDLDTIISGFMIKKSRANLKKEDEIAEHLTTEVKTYCTQFKNFKKNNNNKKKKYELKIQRISYKQSESFLILIEDVSYRDSLVQLRANNEYKNKIMTTLSHEICTPLNGAIPALEDVVSRLEEDNPLKYSLAIPLKSLYILQNVLGDAVDFALINSNQLYLNYEEYNIFEFLKETIDMFSLQVELKKNELSFNFMEGKLPPKKIIADFQRIRQILVSVIGNSLKNTSGGNIDISIEVNPVESPGTKKSKMSQKSPLFRKIFSQYNENEKQEKIVLKFAVEDDGFGIDAAKLENIKRSLKEKNPLEACNNLNRETGCGLGLTISHCLALILGPRNSSGLNIESQRNYGTKTEFSIEFYVEKRPYQEFVNALSTIRETKEITRYSTANAKRKNDGMQTSQRNGFSRLLTNNSKVSKTSKMSKSSNMVFRKKKIVRSISCELLNRIKLLGFDQPKWASLNNIYSFKYCKRPMEIDMTIGSIGKESVHLSQYQKTHEFRTFDNIFIRSSYTSCPNRPCEKNLNSIKSKDSYSHHFDEILKESNCTCAEALIVDDDPFNLNALELILKKFHRKCVKAFNGDEAIKIVQEKYQYGLCGDKCRGFRIIFMDYHMPIKNGVEATKVLKGLMDLEKLPSIPIIACTAFGAKDLVEEWEKAGMSHFLTKPITANKMELILEKWT